MNSSFFSTSRYFLFVFIFLLIPIILRAQGSDYGDAPASYGVPSSDIKDVRLGDLIDSEASGQPTEAADGDDTNGSDDEDGVTFPVMARGAAVSITVSVSGNANLSAWIDWNGNGTFDGGERIINEGRSSGTHNFTINVPEDAVTSKPTYARFRYGSPSNPTSSESSGEIEDYRISIICEPPQAPTIGAITQPSCNLATGSVVLSDLPASGTWKIISSPGNIELTGTGASTTFENLAPGTYTFTVENSLQCVSPPSGNVVIDQQPEAPSSPVPGTVTQPTCAISAGSVALSGLPSPGTWTLTRMPDNVSISGSGTSTTVGDLPAGTFSFTVENSAGCVSASSGSVEINPAPEVPATPDIGTITQPTCTQPTGSVVLNGLPSGSWIINPGSITGTTSSRTIPSLAPGSYSFTVTNSAGCISPATVAVLINAPPATPASPVQSVDCTLGFNYARVTVTSPHADGMTYRLDNGAFQSATIFEGVANGNHTLTVRNSAGCTTTGTAFSVDCGCVNGPTVTLSATSGTTCVGAPLPVEGNTFGASATGVTIAENGAGTVTPSSAGSSPFSFTYTPAAGDAGRNVTITITTNNPLGTPCEPSSATYILTVNQGPSAPVIGAITNPGCNTTTGSVVLSGMPSGQWTLIRTPGDVATPGTGANYTVTGLTPGTYRFSVRNQQQCVSPLSDEVVIAEQPSTPSAPAVGTVTQPTCSVATGSVALSGLPSGSWIINPGNLHGSTRTTTLTNLAAGTYNFTVTNSAGCVSPQSANVEINIQPPSPESPVHAIDCTLGFNHAVITVTRPLGEGYTYRLDNGQFQSSGTFSDVVNGSHTITVRNSAGCSTTGSSFSVSCGCVNGPTLMLSASTGTTCGVAPITVSGNTFGGNATRVTITENGAGQVTPSSSTTSSFSFTYTPVASDAGRTVEITVTTNNPLGSPCEAATAKYNLTVNPTPSAPSAGNIVHPTCTQPQGSLTLTGLPSSGTWTLTRMPGNNETTGTGTSTNVTALNAGSYSFTVRSAAGCTSAASANILINQPPALPPAPVAGAVTQPTCNLSTGSVELAGLPETGTWTIVTNPGDIRITGTGTSRSITGLVSGSYTFSLINSAGCMSLPSQSVVINQQPQVPAAPVTGTITQPGCTTPAGEVVLNNLPSTGTWTLTRLPGLIETTGTGASTRISNLSAGTYNFTVRSQQGCTSAASENIVINVQPATPAPPMVGTITAPTCIQPSGSVVFTSLPEGTWTIIRLPGNVSISGTGPATTVDNLPTGAYSFTVTNAAGCISAASTAEIPANPSAPTLLITDPSPVCSPATVNITLPAITSGSTPGLVLSYWTDQTATEPLTQPEAVGEGTYFIKGTTQQQCSDIKPVIVRVPKVPEAKVGPDKTLDYVFFSELAANPPPIGETGYWTVLEGSGRIIDPGNAVTTVTGLSVGKNVFRWTVTNGVCPDATATLIITVHDVTFPSLITPNEDGKNEYFILEGALGQVKTEFSVFDRRGDRVFYSTHYDNRWNGVDYNGRPLPDGTYFFVVRSKDGKAKSGFIVLRR